jgi:putative copper export protein
VLHAASPRARVSAVTALRLLLHILAASVWVGGQIVLGGLVPTTRSFGPDAPKAVAKAFNRVAWPAFGLAVLTGLWNLMAIEIDELPHPWVELHLLAVVLTAIGAVVHTQARGNKAMLAVGGAMSSLCGVAAMYLGVLVTTEVG